MIFNYQKKANNGKILEMEIFNILINLKINIQMIYYK